MGYRGKVSEQARARALRADGMTLADIATELSVSKGSVSAWVRDVPFTPSKRRYGPRLRPNALQAKKAAEIEWGMATGATRVGNLSDRDLLIAGAALYAGEGAKTDGLVVFANSDPLIIRMFLRWLRAFFDIDESRLRMRLYLHDDLNLDEAVSFWSKVTEIPASQLYKPYRPKAKPGRRIRAHDHGCVSIVYPSARTHREIMGLVRALLTCDLRSLDGEVEVPIRGSSIGRASDC